VVWGNLLPEMKLAYLLVPLPAESVNQPDYVPCFRGRVAKSLKRLESEWKTLQSIGIVLLASKFFSFNGKVRLFGGLFYSFLYFYFSSFEERASQVYAAFFCLECVS
jgi:hypothetical protein